MVNIAMGSPRPVTRVICFAFVYTRTNSVLLAQLMHASSTSALAVLSPAGVSAAQEAVWYLVYGAALWAVVVVVLKRGFGRIAADE